MEARNLDFERTVRESFSKQRIISARGPASFGPGARSRRAMRKVT
jgi:hypothetical protein